MARGTAYAKVSSNVVGARASKNVRHPPRGFELERKALLPAARAFQDTRSSVPNRQHGFHALFTVLGAEFDVLPSRHSLFSFIRRALLVHLL